MTATYDAIVLGVGGFGSAALYHLARRGLSVLGIERFGIAHDRGSSHCETRIIRKAYFEHPDYVPLLHRTYELWKELEHITGRSLYTATGLFLAGPAEGPTIRGALEAARLHGVKVDSVPRSDVNERFSLFNFADDDALVFESEAGFLRVEDCVAAHVAQAARQGATVVTGEVVHAWKVYRNSVQVITDRHTYTSARLVIAAGAWSRQLLDDLSLPLNVLRKVVFWHEIASPAWNGAAAFFFERESGCFYGVPSPGGRTIKLAEHTGGEAVADPLTIDRDCHECDRAPVSRFVEQTLAGVAPVATRHAVCMYTMSPDEHFIVDRHPKHPHIVFGAGFSGHGFKFTPVIGEALADLAIDGRTSLPIEFLSLHRPALASQCPRSSVP